MKRFALFALCMFSLAAQAAPLGRVRISVDEMEQIWVGQRVLVHLDLMSDAFSFSDQRFDLPTLSGAVLLQTDSSTLKLNETIDGSTWQILRYDLSFFAQRAGAFEVPSFGVHFKASAGYGQAETEFDLQTDALQINASLPPGADASQWVITSSQLSVQEQWQPDQLEFKVGEALTRILIIEAEDVAANALPALPDQAIDGIDVLPKAPNIENKSNRGTLSGRRQDELAYLFKRAGSYTLPGGSISWWNPLSQTLETVELEARSLEVAADPLARVATETPIPPIPADRWIVALLSGGLIALLLGVGYWRWPAWQARQNARHDTEPARFKRALKACRANDPVRAWSAVNQWLSIIGMTISAEDRHEWEELQRALLNKDRYWSGQALSASLIRMRRDQQKERERVVYLGPLNP